jgi:hypothetical protein
MNISIFGLGYLGAVIARRRLAAQGYRKLPSKYEGFCW